MDRKEVGNEIKWLKIRSDCVALSTRHSDSVKGCIFLEYVSGYQLVKKDLDPCTGFNYFNNIILGNWYSETDKCVTQENLPTFIYLYDIVLSSPIPLGMILRLFHSSSKLTTIPLMSILMLHSHLLFGFISRCFQEVSPLKFCRYLSSPSQSRILRLVNQSHNISMEAQGGEAV
jgi:hypothetical protein